jgi:pimeloyl-ACP methyl ester carboxylesterase
MLNLWLGIACFLVVPALCLTVLGVLYGYVRLNYRETLLRIFSEKPLFIIPRGTPRAGAEDIRFRTFDGMFLRGCYLKTPQAQRKGVILFGLEFGSNRWACQSYCEGLLAAGYDVFAFEPRNQGESDAIPGYEPLQWLTSYETQDTHAAIAYLKSRSDVDPNGIGFFGLSKGANAGLAVASQDRFVKCLVTDGAFGTRTTMVPYMRKWVSLYCNKLMVHGLCPTWFYSLIANTTIHQASKARGVKYVPLEKRVSRLRQPLLMIHGGGDTYIRPSMAQELFKQAKGEKEFWIVPAAKHNQALQIAGEEYVNRVVGFFNRHLSDMTTAQNTMLAAQSTVVVDQPAVVAEVVER